MGAVGVGGVIIVPAMILILGVEPRLAVASTVPGYLWASGSGTWAYREQLRRRGTIMGLIGGGALVGGFIAALCLRSIPETPLAVGIAVFASGFGAKALRKSLFPPAPAAEYRGSPNNVELSR